MAWTIEVLPIAFGCGFGLMASRRSRTHSLAGKVLASLAAGTLFAAAAGELVGPSGPMAALIDSCGVAAGWFVAETALRRARA
jgi:hypothetical protein